MFRANRFTARGWGSPVLMGEGGEGGEGGKKTRPLPTRAPTVPPTPDVRLVHPVGPAERAAADFPRELGRELGMFSMSVAARLIGPMAGAVTQRKPTAKLGSVAAERDRREAGEYVLRFYGRQGDFMAALDRANTMAIENYSDISRLKDPPSLAVEIIITAASSAFAYFGGWTLVAAGLSGRTFARNIDRLSAGLGERIGSRGRDVLKGIGPSAREQASGQRAAAAAEKVLSPGDPGENIVRTKSEIGAATEEEATTLGVVRVRGSALKEFGDAQARLEVEENAVWKWLKQAENDPEYGGLLTSYVTEALGEIPDPPPQLGEHLVKAAEKIELELYKARFAGRGKLVLTGPLANTAGFEIPNWNSAVENRIAVLINAAAEGEKQRREAHRRDPFSTFMVPQQNYKLDVIAAFLGLPTVIEYGGGI